MQGDGQGFKTLFRKLYFMVLPTSRMRTRYVVKHRELFHHIGRDLFFQPRKFPSDPELISFGDNVKIASNVTFINHDICSSMFNTKYNTLIFKEGGGVFRSVTM